MKSLDEEFSEEIEEAREKLGVIGLSIKSIAIRAVNDAPTLEIEFSEGCGATIDTVSGIYEAIGAELVKFSDGNLERAYWNHHKLMYRKRQLRHWEKRLDTLGLLDHFPRRADFFLFSRYIKALEKHSGVEAGNILRQSGKRVKFDLKYIEPNGKALYRLIPVFSYASLIEDFSFKME